MFQHKYNVESDTHLFFVRTSLNQNKKLHSVVETTSKIEWKLTLVSILKVHIN